MPTSLGLDVWKGQQYLFHIHSRLMQLFLDVEWRHVLVICHIAWSSTTSRVQLVFCTAVHSGCGFAALLSLSSNCTVSLLPQVVRRVTLVSHDFEKTIERELCVSLAIQHRCNDSYMQGERINGRFCFLIPLSKLPDYLIFQQAHRKHSWANLPPTAASK